MGKRFIHSVAVETQSPGADGLFTHDLPVNPLSLVLVVLRPLNETSTLGNFQQTLGICDAVNRVTIAHQGQQIVSMTGRDAAMMALFRHGIHVWEANGDDADNERRAVVLPIVLGRRPYSPQSCFPASQKGQLQMTLDLDIADTGYDGLQYTVETVELPEAEPLEWEKQVEIARTFGATGNQDVDLPLGNVIRGLLLFGTTDFTGASPAPSWGRISTLLDNMEWGYSAVDYEVAVNLAGLGVARMPSYNEHTHRVNAASVLATEETDTPIEYAAPFDNYAWLNFDIDGSDEYSVDTRGRSRFHVRSNAETADAVRVIPVERVLVKP